MKTFNLNIKDLGDIKVKTTEYGDDKKKQRTKEWHQQRLGNWTGSRIKSIMSCNSAGGKMSWDNEDKIYEFSKGVLKYIYSRAKERQSGKIINTPSSAVMDYGTKVEPYIIKASGEDVKEVGYKEHPNIKHLGASSDGIIEQLPAVVEIKACTNWETHYNRTFENVNEKSIDFWQTQLEMLVWDFDKCVYLVSEPPENIFDYINERKVYEDFAKECKISKQIIKSSKFHQKAIIERVKIVDKVCERWINNGGDLLDIFYKTLDEFKNTDNMNEVSSFNNKVESVKSINVSNEEIVSEEFKNRFSDLPF